MKILKNFWIYETKKHSSCYFNSIYLLCVIFISLAWLQILIVNILIYVTVYPSVTWNWCWSIDPRKLKTDLFDLITNPDKFGECDPEHILPLSSSDYYSVSEMNSTFGKAGSNALTLFHCNIRSLPKKLSLLHAVLYCLDSRPNIIAISETRLNENLVSNMTRLLQQVEQDLMSQKVENQCQAMIFNNYQMQSWSSPAGLRLIPVMVKPMQLLDVYIGTHLRIQMTLLGNQLNSQKISIGKNYIKLYKSVFQVTSTQTF